MKRSSVLLSAVLTIFLLIPIASSAASNLTITDIVVTQDTSNYQMKMGTYANLVDTGGDKKLRVGFVKSSNGSIYTIGQYSQALDISSGNVSTTLDKLDTSGKPVTITTVPAKFDSNGNLVTNTNSAFEVIGIE